MNRLTWIIIAVLAYFVLRDRLGGWYSGGITGGISVNSPNVPPPTLPNGNAGHWTDVLNNLIITGGSVLQGILSPPPAARGTPTVAPVTGAGPVSYAA